MRQVTLVLACALLAAPALTPQTSSLRIRGKTIRVGDTADSVFETLKPADSKNTEVRPDPSNPQSLLVTHDYEVEGRAFSLTFARPADPGPYFLLRITMAATKGAPPHLPEGQIIE